jgi:hypothetical protein
MLLSFDHFVYAYSMSLCHIVPVTLVFYYYYYYYYMSSFVSSVIFAWTSLISLEVCMKPPYRNILRELEFGLQPSLISDTCS